MPSSKSLFTSCLNYEIGHDCKWKTRALLTSNSALYTVEGEKENMLTSEILVHIRGKPRIEVVCT